jgi:hypothetical protein
MGKEDAKKLFYNPGDFIWRRQDNALFKVAQIIHSGDLDQYELICVNGVGDNTYASCVKLSVDHTIFTPIAPSDLKLNQHIWNKSTGREYVVTDIFLGETPKHPCRNCHDGICEQCMYGYKSDAQIMSMIGNGSSDTKYRVESLDHKRSYDIDNNALKEDSEFTIYPPHKVGLTSEGEAEAVMNENLEKESVDTDVKIDSYEKWKKSLKIVNIPKFDLNYFKRGVGYHVEKRACYPGAFDGILMEATEDLLKVMKLGNSIHFESTEIIEIPLKEYTDGKWRIVRLVEEEKENA